VRPLDIGARVVLGGVILVLSLQQPGEPPPPVGEPWDIEALTADHQSRADPYTPPPPVVAPVPEPVPAPPRAARVSRSGDRPSGLWHTLAVCESGANPAINTGNGYLGAYQFSPRTWQGVTGGKYGGVLDNGWAVQTYVAWLIWDRQGWGAYPGCGKKMGYPEMPAVAAP